MIRKFELFCNLNRINKSDLQLFTEATKSITISNLTCPTCGARHSCVSHGRYNRSLIAINAGRVAIHEIHVSRVICISCKHTHTILPAHLIPFGSYSLFFILAVLRDKFIGRYKVAQLCEHYQISPSTLYAWISLYKIQKELWLGVIKNLPMSSFSFLDILIQEENFLVSFFKMSSLSFLQPFPKATNSPPP